MMVVCVVRVAIDCSMLTMPSVFAEVYVLLLPPMEYQKGTDNNAVFVSTPGHHRCSGPWDCTACIVVS